MTDAPTKLPKQDQDDRIATLEAQLAQSRKEIVTLSKMILGPKPAPASSKSDETTNPAQTGAGMDPDMQRAMFKVMRMSLHLTRVPLVMRFDFMRRRHQRRLANALQSTGLIDPAWYRKTYPDVAASGIDPALYFVTKGMTDGHAPHPKLAQGGEQK